MRIAAVAVATMGLLFIVAALVPPSAPAAITPQVFEATLKPGETVTLTKEVDVPDVPRNLDLMLVVDLTGSYADDLPRIKALAPAIFDGVRARAPNSRFGLITFVDFPFSPWGVAGEYAYRLEQQPTDDKATWLAAVNGMRSLYGNDGPESQYEALFQGATGEGREMPNTTDGDYDDPGEIAPGQGAQLRDFAARVFAITTDSDFHRRGDLGPFPYPGASRDQTVNALFAVHRIKVVAIKAPGSTSQMDDIANATEGAVTTTNSTSDQIADAITSGIGDLTFNIRGIDEDCAPLDVSLDPAAVTADAGAHLTFTETIRLPADVPVSELPASGVVECRVRFRANGSPFGVQGLRIVVNRPPDCSGVKATPDSLWPADHKLRQVGLAGATDPDGDSVALTIKRVTQDEPLDGLGDGDTAPDAQAGASPSSMLLRAERSGKGDGRVYVIEFEGRDGRGGDCTGQVSVSVPKSQAAKGAAVDSGQSYVSFGL
jgi:hypothetical protein